MLPLHMRPGRLYYGFQCVCGEKHAVVEITPGLSREEEQALRAGAAGKPIRCPISGQEFLTSVSLVIECR